MFEGGVGGFAEYRAVGQWVNLVFAATGFKDTCVPLRDA